MNLPELGNKHIHVWAKSIDGAEYGNAIYDNEVDASLVFLGLIKNISKGNIANDEVKIEHVMQSLDEGRKGMYAGYPGLIVVISRCEGKCHSPVWN